jgi:hypothetical protein
MAPVVPIFSQLQRWSQFPFTALASVIKDTDLVPKPKVLETPSFEPTANAGLKDCARQSGWCAEGR